MGRLVLIGPFVHAVPPESWVKGLMQTAMIKVAFVGPWAPAAWGSYFASLFPTAKPADFDTYRKALIANLSEPGRMAAVKAMINGGHDDVERRLGEVHAPALVVMGTQDPDFPDPAKEANVVADLLHGEVRLIDGAGHYPHAEMPDATVPAILDFLAGSARN